MIVYNNTAKEVYFKPAENELNTVASRLGNATPEELRMLQKGQCLVMGQFMQADSKLSNLTYHIVEVLAMDSRGH